MLIHETFITMKNQSRYALVSKRAVVFVLVVIILAFCTYCTKKHSRSTLTKSTLAKV